MRTERVLVKGKPDFVGMSETMNGHDAVSDMIVIMSTIPPGLITTVMRYLVIRTAAWNAVRECN